MIINNEYNILKLYSLFTPLKLIDEYSPDKSYDKVLIKILSRYILFSTGFIGISICMVIHRIIYEIYKNKHIKNTIPEITCTDETKLTSKNISNLSEIRDLVYKESGHYIFENTKYNAEEKDNIINKSSETSWNFMIDDNLKEEYYYKILINTIKSLNLNYKISFIDDINSLDQYLYEYFMDYKNHNQETIVLTDIRNQVELNSKVFKHLITYIDMKECLHKPNYITEVIMDTLNSRT